MKKKSLFLVIIPLVIILVFIVMLTFNHTKISADAIKFKEEYEALNNTIRESDGATYNSITIPKKNPIKYVDCAETLNILEKKKAILYIGAEWCPWCRNAVPVLFKVAEKYNVDEIYYLNLDKEKDSFEIKDGEVIKTVNGAAAYYKLLKKLDNELENYILTDDNGKKYDTGEKRIYMPFVLTIKNGKVVDTHLGTTGLNENQTKYDPLTEEQEKKLYNVYSGMLKTLYNK